MLLSFGNAGIQEFLCGHFDLKLVLESMGKVDEGRRDSDKLVPITFCAVLLDWAFPGRLNLLIERTLLQEYVSFLW